MFFLDLSTAFLVALSGLVAWLLFRRKSTTSPTGRDGWRWVPVAAGGVVAVITPLTLGAGILLAPFALALTIVAAIRLGPRRGAAFWLGATLTVLLTIGFVVSLVIVAHDVAVGNR